VNNYAKFCQKSLKIDEVVNCRIFGTENRNIQCCAEITDTGITFVLCVVYVPSLGHGLVNC